jgi:hypothetical protein
VPHMLAASSSERVHSATVWASDSNPAIRQHDGLHLS